MNLLLARLNHGKALILLNAVYMAAGLAWITLIPYNNAPDENTHFRYSVEFILKNHRLPVWGVDDIERFRYALSSYNQLPALNYVLYAVGAATAQKFFGLETYLGARLVSLGWGLVFLNFLFLAVKEACGNKENALLVTAALALIPQVLFSFCYVNGDAHSLAIAAMLGFALMRFIRRPTTPNIIFLGAAIGLLFSAKYNYYIYFPAIAILLIWAAGRRAVSWQTIGKLIIVSVLFSLLISGFWFIRNYFLYGNPLPLLLSEDFFQGMALAREVQPVNRGLNMPALVWMIKNGFIGTTFNSFFAVFGYLNVGFPREIYLVLRIGIPLLAALFIIRLSATKDRLALAGLAWLLLLISAVMAVHVWACLTYDYQPQGRYQFAVLIPIALYLAWVISRHIFLRKYAVFFLTTMVGLFIGANLLVARTYGPPVQFSVSWSGPDKSFQRLKCSPQKAKRIRENFYATENIPLGNEPIASLRIDLPSAAGGLARYRDFQLELATNEGVITNDWASAPPEQLVNVKFDQKLNAFETSGKNPCFILSLKDKACGAKSVKIGCRIENRRLYDLR